MELEGQPILFLDIDGVLNSREWMMEGHMRSEKPLGHFAPHLCARLERVLVETGCLIVVSSAWRVTHSPEAIQRFLRGRGAPSAICIDSTPVWKTCEAAGILSAFDRRGSEIQAWIDDNHDDIGSIAIVDDNSDMGHLRHRLVQTTWEKGLQDSHVTRLIRLLSED